MKFFRTTILTLLFLPVLMLPGKASAQWLENAEVIDIAPNGAQYMITTTLQVGDLSSLMGLALLVIIDQDNIEPPYDVKELPAALNNDGTISVLMTTPYNPDGYYFQFFLVDNDSFTANSGISGFNPENNSVYSTYIASDISHDEPGAGGNPSNPNNPTNPNPNNPNDPGTPGSTATTPVALGPFQFQSINNPLGQNFNIIGFLQRLFANLVKIALPILVIFMVISGFMFVEAQGNHEKLAKARKNFVWVIIGALLVFGAWTIAMVLKGTIEQLSAPIAFVYHIINLV